MDAKDTWPVVKFLISATGLKKKDVRKLLEQIPEDRFGQLFIQARTWDRLSLEDAAKRLGDILGDAQIELFIEATRRSRLSATEQYEQDREEGGDEEESEEEAPKPRRKPQVRPGPHRT